MMIGSRRELRERERVGELPVGQPMLHVDGITVHFGNRGVAAADGKQRQHREEARERQ